MEEFEPKKKTKIISKEFIAKYAYVFVLAVLLIGGVSYSYTFFTENRKIASGSITTANLTINFTDRSVNASNLSVPANDKEGLVEFVKSVTITNQTSIDGRVKLTLTRTSGLELTDLRYALVINGAIQEINDVPANGEILSSAIMGNEVINVEVRLWPKTTYAGSETTFVGELTPEIKYLGSKATTSIASPAGKYVNFNCNGTNCEVWQIVKIESDRLVLTRQADYSGASSRTNSNKYDSSLTFNDNSLITSVSTDGKNVYLARTVKLNGGNGTQDNPYKLINNDFREGDKKVIAVITYKNGTDIVGTQNVYYNETNYISQVIDDGDFVGWTDGTNDYEFGDVVNFTSDITLNAIIKITPISVMKRNVDTETTINFANVSSDTNGKGLYILPGTESDTNPIYYYRGAVDNNNVIFGGFCWLMVRTTETGGIKMIYNGVATGTTDNPTCENAAGTARQLASTSKINTNYTSMSDVGYMYNQRYAYSSGAAASGSIFGKNVEWNGTSYLVIDDTSGTASSNTTLDANHHYTCGTASTTTCTSVRYYYYNSDSAYYYITLTNGDTIEDALYKMTGNGSSETKTKNAGYKLNTTSSVAKTNIENWFKTNLTNEVDASKTNYQEYLEDTTWCNDRSYSVTTGMGTYEEAGWNPNGGSITTNQFFAAAGRIQIKNYYSSTNVPVMTCPNVTDQFRVGNSEAKLNYPVGLLTADEIILAGASGNSATYNGSYYLQNNISYYWSLSPSYFSLNARDHGFYASGFGMNYGYISSNYVYNAGGLRPSVSLKPGTEFEEGGDGTPTNPYVVKYE